MTGRILMFKKAIALMVFVVVFGMSSAVMGATIMNGKEVTPCIGHIVSHNERTDEIVVKMDNSTGHWRLNKHTVVFSGKDRLTLSEIWSKTKKVRVYVSRDGEVQRISILEWKQFLIDIPSDITFSWSALRRSRCSSWPNTSLSASSNKLLRKLFLRSRLTFRNPIVKSTDL